MKKIILILLVLLGLQTQAQIIYCDSISYTATTSNTLVDLYTHAQIVITLHLMGLHGYY